MTLAKEIKLIKKQLAELTEKLKTLSDNREESKNKPYSKVGIDRLATNQDLVFDGNDGIWKNYAIYKDDE